MVPRAQLARAAARDRTRPRFQFPIRSFSPAEHRARRVAAEQTGAAAAAVVAVVDRAASLLLQEREAAAAPAARAEPGEHRVPADKAGEELRLAPSEPSLFRPQSPRAVA